MAGNPFELDLGSSTVYHVRQRAARIIDTWSEKSEHIGLTLGQTTVYGRWFSILIGFVFLCLFARLFILQGIQGSNMRQRADANRVRTQILPAPRGAIIDRQGKTLAENVPNFVLSVVPADLPTGPKAKAAALGQTASLTGLSVDVITAALKNPQRLATDPIPVVEHVPEAQALQWMTTTKNWPWISVQALPSRSYPAGDATASFLGYIGAMSSTDLQSHPERSSLDVSGKTGLEKQYDTALTGSDGRREVERDVRSQEQSVLSQIDPVPGNTLQVSIDKDLQQTLHDRLSAEVKKYPMHSGAAVILDPNTGAVMAMDSEPSYDDNWFVTSGHNDDIRAVLQDPLHPLLNRVISGQYPSGSIVKPMLAAAGLNEKVITPSTTVNSTGGIRIGNEFFPDWKAGGHGITDVYKAIADSVNTFFYVLGGGYNGAPGLGVDRIVKYLQLFGWGSPLGIDLPHEASGFLPTKDWRDKVRPSPWRLGDTYHLSIGQGDLQVTPLQVADAYAAIANGGTLYKPSLVSAVLDATGNVYQRFTPQVIRTNIVPASVLATVQQAMRDGVLNGSSRSLQSLPVTSAGKTGTAQFGNEGKTHSWYGAYAPYDHPQMVIIVIVEGGGEGNAAALPVAKDVMQWYFTRPGATPAAVDMKPKGS